MSSGSINTAENRQFYMWNGDLDPSSYSIATYDLMSTLDGEQTAIAIAMEQSATKVHLRDYAVSKDIGAFTARVVSVEETTSGGSAELAPYNLDTEVYRWSTKSESRALRISIAFPNRLLMDRPGQWLNVLIGEIPRLGFITSLNVESIDLSGQTAPGPAFGVTGIRERLGVKYTPLLCRSTSPSVGLDLQTIRQINTDVLANGFHAVKDDELQAWPDASSYAEHVAAMVSARKKAEDATGEKKFFIANLLCEPWEVSQRIDIAKSAGVDAFLVAPSIQGLSVLSWVRNEAQLPLLAHNSLSEMICRHPDWRIDPALHVKLLRACGADWIVTPGQFATPASDQQEEGAFVAAVQGEDGSWPATMPILQGGKNPDDLPKYIKSAQGLDFMLIVASWVDGHPDGLKEAARIFRRSVDEFQG